MCESYLLLCSLCNCITLTYDIYLHMWYIFTEVVQINLGLIGASRHLTGSPMGLPTFFFFFFLLGLGFLPPPKMAVPEAKHNEGNLVLTWYFRITLL